MADNTFSTTIGGVTTSVNLDLAYDNLVYSYDGLFWLIQAVGYSMGIFMLLRGIFMYRAFGQHITQMSRGGELAGPAVYIIVGAFMLYLPTTIDAALTTTFGDSIQRELSVNYNGSNTGGIDWEKVLNLVNLYARLVGYVAFVRGMYLVSKAGDPGVQPGTISRGIVHFVAGVLLINIGGTYDVLKQTFGLSVSS